MGVLCLYPYATYSVDGKATAFCKCKQWHNGDAYPTSMRHLKNCHCGEEDSISLQWSWDTEIGHPEAQISAVTVLFHPVYSQGTSVVRGHCALDKQSIHYWEIKIVSCFSGTDLVSAGRNGERMFGRICGFMCLLPLDGWHRYR